MEGTKKGDDFTSTIFYRIAGTLGASSSILIIVLIASLLKLIPENANGIVLSIGLFISLPFVFSFIFGIITNKPDFSTLRHYGFGVYFIIALVIYFLYIRPDSFMLFGKYLVQFFIGFFIALIAGLLYLAPYYWLRRKKYRVKASVSFGISLFITLIIIFILKHYKIFEMIS